MPKIVENGIVVYTDGSMYPKGRRAGYGLLFVHHDPVGNETELDTHCPPGLRGPTNNSMELQAVIEALERVRDFPEFSTVGRIVIRSDSQYVTRHFMNAFESWPKRKWHTLNGTPVENVPLWREFVREFKKVRASGKRIDIEWIKGKSDPYTKLVDRAAKESAKSPLSRRVHAGAVRRKLSPNKLAIGCVAMRGQTMIIRVFYFKQLRPQRVWKFHYEVMSTESKDFAKVDRIYGDEVLRHSVLYEVRVNDDTSNPRILQVIREISPMELAEGHAQKP